MSPALDYINKTDDKLVDVSAAATASSNAVTMNKSGLVDDLAVIVEVTNLSAANFNTSAARQLHFYFEVTTDNSIYRRYGATPGIISAAGVPIQVLEIPVGFHALSGLLAATSSNVKWRVTADIGSTLADTDDFNFIAYLGPRAGIPAPVLIN